MQWIELLRSVLWSVLKAPYWWQKEIPTPVPLVDGSTERNVLTASVVVSIRTRKVFAEVRKMFLYARRVEKVFWKGRLVRTSEPNSCSYEAA